MSTKLDEIRKEIQRLTKREAELLQAKTKLERNSMNNRAEIAIVRAKAKEEGKQEVINHLLPVLPKTTMSSQSVSYRKLATDVLEVIESFQKGKNDKKR